MTEPAAMIPALRGLLQALVEPVLDPTSRTWWPGLLAFGVVAIVYARILGRRGPAPSATPPREPAGEELSRALGLPSWRHPSARLDLQLLAVRQLLGFLGWIPRLGFAGGLAVALARGLDAGFGRPELPALPQPVMTTLYGLVLFVAWDASRYLLHRALHEVPLLWRFHQIHHSAEVLTPMTFHRVHPVESLLYDLRGGLVSGLLGGVAWWLWRGVLTPATLLGVDAMGLGLTVALGNLRHSHVWLRFPAAVERWLLSPAQHQLHHGADRADMRANYGVWLACWDRLAGSLRLAPDSPPRALGVPAHVRSHDHELLGALLAPFLPRRARPERTTA